MPTLVANIVAGLLGVGVTTTSIAVPVAVFSSGGSNNTQTEKSPSQVIPHETSTVAANSERTKEDGLKKDCYGGFLSQEGEGELVFCIEKENNEKKELDFYLYWTKGGEKKLTPIEKINVSVISQGKQLEVWFVKRGQMSGIKKIIVQKNEHDNLNWMSLQTLKNICTRTKDESGTSLTCNYRFTNAFFNETYTYKHSVREIKFEQSLLGGA